MPQSCLDDATANQLVTGTLPCETASETEDHILSCETCLQLVQETVADSDELLSALQVHTNDQAATQSLDHEVDQVIEHLDQLAGTVRTTAAALEEIHPLLAPCDSAQEKGLGRFDQYRIIEIIGAGGMGIVLKAIDDDLNRTVALKIMRPSLAVNEQAKERFRREAMAVAAFEHDHIVTVYQVQQWRGIPFFTMQLLAGESLRQRLARTEKLSLHETMRITREIATGLEAAHARGLLHRDIKPDNIWLEEPAGRVKILDFGLVHSLESSASLTASGAILGTPEYMAPEQACGEAIDQRCDLFSVGCVLYHMLTGQPPFQGKNVVATLVAVSNAKVSPPHKVTPSVPRAVSDLTMKLLQRQPQRRIDSAKQLSKQVTAIEGQLPQLLTTESRSTRMKRALKYLFGVVAATIVAGIIAIQTDRGTLYVDTGADDQVEALIKGQTVELRDKARNKTYSLEIGTSKLKSGEYEIIASQEGSDLEISSKSFTLRRGELQHVRVWLEKKNEETEKAEATPLAEAALRKEKILTELRKNKKIQADTVSRLQQLVKALAKQLGTPLGANGLPHAGPDPIQAVQEAIHKAHSNATEVQASILALQRQLETNDPSTSSIDLSATPAVSRLTQQIAEYRTKLATLSTQFGDSSPQISEVKKQLDALRRELRETQTKLSTQALRRQLALKESQLFENQELLQLLEQKLAILQKEQTRQGIQRLELDFASAELQRALDLFAKISQREAEMVMDLPDRLPPIPSALTEAAQNVEKELAGKITQVEFEATDLEKAIAAIEQSVREHTTAAEFNEVSTEEMERIRKEKKGELEQRRDLLESLKQRREELKTGSRSE